MEKIAANPNRTVVLASFAVAWLLATSGLAIYVAAAAARPSAMEESLADTGTSVRRDPAGPLDALTASTPATLILVAPPPLLAAERGAIASYVTDGGTLWVIGLYPENALQPGLASQIRVLPGVIYGSQGGRATFRLTEDHASFARSGAREILSDIAGARALVSAEASDVRDTNGDGILEPGEPTGPFTIAVGVPLGRGQIIILAADPTPADGDAVPYANLLPDAAHDAVIIDYEHPAVWARPMQSTIAMISAVPQTWWLDACLAGIVAAVVLLARSPTRVAPTRSKAPRDLIDAFRTTLSQASLSPDDPLWRTLEDPPS